MGLLCLALSPTEAILVYVALKAFQALCADMIRLFGEVSLSQSDSSHTVIASSSALNQYYKPFVTRQSEKLEN